ncbi:unnamed protein product [Microthlaspi erraticum]|uniref:Ubiquitin-like protease family profile domain-containing protein n=1 Tax=Microthlaspi erraticum TaxID=1685480 RepID=A0A6D2JU40_9BRAS|nr:unnamed protein product [Microthlaspi erraticum]
METAKGMHIDGPAVQQLYDASAPPTIELMEGVIGSMQQRRDTCRDCAYDFIPPSYITGLKRDYGAFVLCSDKDTFSVSDAVRLPLPNRPNIVADVTQLYCPYMIDGKHWVGVVIDLSTRSITVLDCNTACVTVAEMENYLQPLSAMLPYIIRHACDADASNALPGTPFPIKRLDISLLCEAPGLSAVATLALIELHATNQLLAAGDIDDETLRTASRNYAVSLCEYLEATDNT